MTSATVGSAGGGSAAGGSAAGGRSGRRRRRRGDPNAVVPDAEFTSYYGRPVVKPSPWTYDIPAYLFLGGLAGGSSLLAAGAAATGRDLLARNTRITAATAISASFYFLVHDLGRPERFLHMLRVAKPTSPMSMGTWLLMGYGPAAALAAGAEVAGLAGWTAWPFRLLRPLAGPAGVAAAALAPGVATYTGVLLADTATPAWSSARRELPGVFAASACAAAGGLALALTPPAQSGPALRLAVAGAVVELAVLQQMERSMGLAAETLRAGNPGRMHTAARAAAATGALLCLAGRRSRVASLVGGLVLVAGSVSLRHAVFYAGQASARDPKYTVVPQRERLDRAARG